MSGVLIAFIAVCAIVFAILAYLVLSKRTYVIWELVRKWKKHSISNHISNIQTTYNRASGIGKKISTFEKLKVKKDFEKSKAAFTEYIQYCDSKKLSLTDDEERLKVAVDETIDLLDPAKALDRKLERSTSEYNHAYQEVNSSGEMLLETRQESARIIEKIKILINSIAKHPKEFDKEIEEIIVQKNKFRDAIDFGLREQKAAKVAAGSAGAGVAAGAAVASMAPTAAMWVATTFGTASTGTAISALSGAAATNAALAWLGGGALAAGGSGMAAGQALLALAGPVGWGVAGGSALMSVLLLWRKRKNLQESKKDEVSRIQNCTHALKSLKSEIDAITIQTDSLNKSLLEQFGTCCALHSGDYTAFTDDQKHLLGAVVNNTKSLSLLISKVLAAEDEHDTDKKKRKA